MEGVCYKEGFAAEQLEEFVAETQQVDEEVKCHQLGSKSSFITG
eukprot:CAMPEP_0196587042 /NCGR_PEP_ID=MMETSP1081-20130531/56258_1 /TAXON_ID=36882 /ORGANISM="Pyramimonas amylifera, Strain CCMP720" /LENGTH=43 /DNA_ID= /DNA_START= /DNA_END= /DNA_ORIENTATION=